MNLENTKLNLFIFLSSFTQQFKNNALKFIKKIPISLHSLNFHCIV